jgi:hypothetical protein
MELHSPPESKSFSLAQEIRQTSCNQNIHYTVNNSQQRFAVISHVNPIHILPFDFTIFSIIFDLCLCLQRDFHPSGFCTKVCPPPYALCLNPISTGDFIFAPELRVINYKVTNLRRKF